MTLRSRPVPEAALTGSLRDFRSPEGPDLIDRIAGFYDWQNLRREHNLWPYARSISTAPQAHCDAQSDTGEPFSGINFGSQDYLNLSSHPAVKAAAIDAINQFGVHSAGSAALLGNTSYSLQLEQAMSRFLGDREIVLYPTGWAAGYGAVQAIVRPNDHVILDILAHSCLQEGAKAATQNVHFHGHLNLEALARKLSRIREEDKNNGILVVTESLYSMHSDTPDLRAIRTLCDQFNAILLVDCAHDLGSVGDDGLGHLGLQNAMDAVDIIVGSFSKTLGSNGGFVAVKDKATSEYLKYFSASHTFSNALSPMQAASVLAALTIVRSEEGRALRRKLMDNIVYMRDALAKAGLEAMGNPSPIVPVRLGVEAVGRFASRNLMDLGGIANLVEYPAVPQGGSRFRFQVMASHTHEDIDQVVDILARAMREADLEYRLGHEGQSDERRARSIA
ncbi:aminotransferase class I/II-fold pyridoxal phosphate-dependent enzyme [Devosia sp. 2618]|uniref:aminotransferase class I/II-fold pyridoxal phosphate-dependent enzyme n=1 Tax=Devosia sp. 2618 TaxID=3156454 RepID=UPI003393BC7A